MFSTRLIKSGWSVFGRQLPQLVPFSLPWQRRLIHTGAAALLQKSTGLSEFFDSPLNYGERFVKVGRGWRVDELRIRSNTDLHKLWYVLLKERNMLLTMEHECKRQSAVFPNPERLDKVEDSLSNIETVVRERNRAYALLETGNSGERPGSSVENFLGLQEYWEQSEHHIEKDSNGDWLREKSLEPQSSDEEKRWFLVRFNVLKRREMRREKRSQQFIVLHTLRNHPQSDLSALQELFPLVNVKKYYDRVLVERDSTNLAGLSTRELFHSGLRL